MQIVRKKLAPDQVTPATIRYNPDCDCVEQTWDGGATWTPTPGADPRSSTAFRAPANSTDQPQCNAAANMVAALRDMVDADVSADNQLALATLLLGTALLFVPVAGWIADAFLLVADAIILLDQATIEAAFTSTVYDDLLCTFFCYLDADGQMSDAQLADFLVAVFTDYDFTVWKVISNHSDTLGAVGWSNMGALGTGTGSDCSECDCGPWCWEWTEAEIYAVGGSWTVDHFLTTHAGTTADAGFVSTIIHAEFDYSLSGFGAFVDGNAQIYDQDFPSSTLAEDAATDPTGTLVYDDPLGVAVTAFGQAISSQFASGSNYPVITRIRLEGSSARPAFTNGTDCS